MTDSYTTIADIAEGTYSELRSKFLAFAIPVRTADEALDWVAQYQKEYFDARHVCWAYRLGADGQEYRSNDNGEPSGTAGKPILGQLISHDLSDVLLVVVRYFGGVKLGTSGLIVAYRTAASEALAAANKIERIVEQEMKLTFTYDHMNLVMRMVKDLSPRIISQDYTDDGSVMMRISIRLSYVDRVRSYFIVNGQSVVRIETD
ncbi:MAG: IMPACT family protein [Bacteroidaceae bacterium]|nr:IMPACT family protein [Bacteroidaceae bacterium]